MPLLHGGNSDVNGENGEPAPLGGGIAVLAGLGAAYAFCSKRKED